MLGKFNMIIGYDTQRIFNSSSFANDVLSQCNSV